MNELFAIDGRVTDLTLERLHYGELDADEAQAVQDHLAQNAGDAERYAHLLALEEEAAAIPMPPALADRPSAAAATTTTARPSNNFRYLVYGCIGAAAAVFTMQIAPEGDPEEIQYRGSGLEMLVFLEGSSTPLGWEADVRAGDRLGFQVGSEHDGYLAITGLDATGGAYAVYPQGDAAVAWGAGPPRLVDAAIQLDATGEWERLLALHCASPFTTREIQISLSSSHIEGSTDPLRDLRKDCAQTELLLRKVKTP